MQLLFLHFVPAFVTMWNQKPLRCVGSGAISDGIKIYINKKDWLKSWKFDSWLANLSGVVILDYLGNLYGDITNW